MALATYFIPKPTAMKTDKIFYTIFLVFPELLFQLIGQPSELAQNYEFKSVEIKELSFTFDGIFIPNDNTPSDIIYFVEVQFQRNKDFYWRFITEIILYLNQYKHERQWQAVVVWAKKSFDHDLPLAYQMFKPNLKTIYLDQLPQTSSSLGLGILQLITIPAARAPQQTQSLITQARQEIADASIQQNIIELISKVIVYKFPEKSSQELEQMFNLTEWKQTKFYQEAKAEGKLEGELEGELKGKLKGELETKLKTVPLLLRLGLTVEQIAQELGLELEKIQQVISSDRN